MATNEDYARVIIKILCRNNCYLTIGKLNKYLKDDGIHIFNDPNNLSQFIKNFPGTFSISTNLQTADEIISISTPVPLCRDHCSNNSQCHGWPNCTSLHICKFFLLSDCRRKSCPFGHLIQTDHNHHVLARFLLDRLDDNEIKRILRHVKNRSDVTRPDVCISYNTLRGCSRTNCGFLHVCKRFLENTCDFGETCKRSHDITTPGAASALRRFGIDMNRSIELVLQDLRTMFISPDSPSGTNKQKPQVRHRSGSRRRQKGRRERSLSPNPPKNSSADGSVPQPEDFGGARPKIIGQNPILNAIPDGRLGPIRGPSSFDCHGLLPTPGQGLKKYLCLDQNQHLSELPVQGQSRSIVEIQERTSRKQIAVRGRERVSNEGQAQPILSKQISKNKENPYICLFNISRFCFRRNNCSNVHKGMIYQWQYHSNDWNDFDSNTNEEIEMNYCDPNKEECFVERGQGEVGKISFTEPMEMTTGSDETKMAVRRLSTISSVNAPPGKFKWTTEWQWFWNLDGIWILYGEKDVIGAKSNMDSNVIEERYLEDPKASVEFKTSDFRYKLDFSAMTQENLNTGTSRKVARRPSFFKKGDLEKRNCPSPSEVESVPQEWTIPRFHSAKSLLEHFDIVKLEKTSDEYIKIADLFSKTMQPENLRQIARIECGVMWTNYSLKRKQMMTKSSGMTVNELSLFHGTDENYIEPICRQGFDFRFSGTRVGAKLGRGSYFARDAKYSSCYSNPNDRGHAKMFVAKVLVGDYKVGDPSYVRPPEKSKYELYDSCVDDKSDPSIYVVFTLDQAYPEYLITYKAVRL